MIQRIQSLYLATVCITMATFLRTTVWMKVTSDSLLTIRPYALITSTGECVIFPYGLPSLLICYLIVTAVYAMMRHDNRKLQLRLIAHINLALVIAMALIVVLINKANTIYLLNGYGSYKIGTIFIFIALIVNLLARHHIKKDEQLVNEDRLR